MKPVTFFNTEKTIAFCTGYCNKADCIGKFNPKMLRDFAQVILDNFGEEPVYLYSHYSTTCTARALSATVEFGDDMQIGLAGIETGDLSNKQVAKDGT
jgi:hypothetical protein